MALRVLSLNAWGGRLHAPLMQYLADTDPDILCLQEVVRTPGRSSDWLVYRDQGVELPQRSNVFEEISAAFPNHDAYFCPSLRGELFEGDNGIWSEFGLATLVRKSYPVVGQALDFVHGAFSADGWGPHPRSRNAHCIRLFNTADGFPVTVAHMHGLRDLAGKGDGPARHAQAHSLAALIRRIWRPGERLIVCGDFNVLPESTTFDILGELGLADLVTARGFTDTRTSYYSKEGRYADYMMVTPQIEVVSFEVVEQPEVSDHRPLLLELR